MKSLSSMLCTGLAAATALPVALAFPSFHTKRTYAASDAVLYAYGTNVSGLPILYSVSDGLLYIAESAGNASDTLAVTWDIPALSSASTTESSATLPDGTSPGVMSTEINEATLSDVAIADGNSTSNATTTGYTLFGKQLVYYDGSALQAKFWVKPVQSGVWKLLWNSPNEDQDELTPVSIKTTAPSTTTS